jgi:hypothetical protein
MKTLLLLLSCALSVQAGASDNLDALVDKIAAAYGGQVTLEKLVAVRETGRVEAVMSNSAPKPVVRTFARPLRLRVEIGESSKPSEVRIVDGAKGWRNGQESTGVGYEAMVLQAVRLDLPFQLSLHRKALLEKDPADFQSKRLRVLELPLEHGLSILAGIEPETGRILFSRGTTKTGSTTLETRYEDFRTVEGYLFAFKETNFAGDTKTADIVLTKIEFPRTPSSEAFKP